MYLPDVDPSFEIKGDPDNYLSTDIYGKFFNGLWNPIFLDFKCIWIQFIVIPGSESRRTATIADGNPAIYQPIKCNFLSKLSEFYTKMSEFYQPRGAGV